MHYALHTFLTVHAH